MEALAQAINPKYAIFILFLVLSLTGMIPTMWYAWQQPKTKDKNQVMLVYVFVIEVITIGFATSYPDPVVRLLATLMAVMGILAAITLYLSMRYHNEPIEL